MNRNILVVGAVVALIVAFGLAARAYRSDSAQATAVQVADAGRAELLDRAGAQRLGSPSARVTIVEFFDPACETCAQFAPHMKELVTLNPDRVQLIQRYAPLHPGSDKVVAILEAARRQDKYWETLEIMFSQQGAWASHHSPQPELLWGLLEAGGLDVARLRAEMTDPAIAAAIAEDVKDAKALGVTQTPEFFVNGKPLPTWGLRQLDALVASELEASY